MAKLSSFVIDRFPVFPPEEPALSENCTAFYRKLRIVAKFDDTLRNVAFLQRPSQSLVNRKGYSGEAAALDPIKRLGILIKP
jgi:hypothetical protein